MPRNKDLKHLVRARMQKTGESYTAAGAARPRGAHRTPRDAAPRSKWPELAGMSHAAVKAKTGRTWTGWVDALDAAGAHRWTHRAIAKHLVDAHELDAWWSQTVTVGYERIRGLRDVGQRRDGGYDANKSRTFAVDVSTLYAMFADARKRKRWLAGGWERARTSTRDKSMRVDWSDGTDVRLYFTEKGPGKSAVSIQHAKLASREDVAAAKAAWSERLDALRDALA